MPWALRDRRVALAPPGPVDRRGLWLAMLLAVALRFSASTQSLWYDEIASLGTYVAHGPGVIVANAFTTANHPLQSLLSWCCLPLGVEPWVRLPSMLTGALAVLGGWCIGRALRDGGGRGDDQLRAVAAELRRLPADLHVRDVEALEIEVERVAELVGLGVVGTLVPVTHRARLVLAGRVLRQLRVQVADRKSTRLNSSHRT